MTETFWGILIPFWVHRWAQHAYFYAARSGRSGAALTCRLCRRCDGGGIGLEPADPGNRTVGEVGAVRLFPAFAGFWFGVLFLLALDHLIPHLHVGSEEAEGPKVGWAALR